MRVIASDTHRLHDTVELSRGQMLSSAECPQRADTIASALRQHGHEFIEPDRLDHGLLARVHTADYVDFLRSAWDRWVDRMSADVPAMPFAWPRRGEHTERPDDVIGQLGYHSFAADSAIMAGTWTAVADSAAIAQTAARLVGAGERFAYGLCRPPGHHATVDQFGGYCFLNNSAIAAQQLLDGGHSRVAVLDVDYHHGNGTQSIFYERSDVLTVSMHIDPAIEFPWFAGYPDETGDDDGDGWNLNLPLAPGTSTGDWIETLDVAITHIADRDVSAVVVALGLDTFIDDPLGTFTLRTDDYTSIAGRISQLGMPTVIIQEGGYATDDLGANAAAFLRGFGS